jgi:hypothetical protein
VDNAIVGMLCRTGRLSTPNARAVRRGFTFPLGQFHRLKKENTLKTKENVDIRALQQQFQCVLKRTQDRLHVGYTLTRNRICRLNEHQVQ